MDTIGAAIATFGRRRRALLAVAVVPLLGFGVSLAGGCSGKSAGAKDAEAKSGTSAQASGKPARLTWAAYDKRMEEYAECLRKNGMPSARYKGHDENAKAGDEMAGIPSDANKKLYPAIEKCNGVDPSWEERPVPFSWDKATPEELVTGRAIARCVRSKGVPDYPDPVADPNGLSNAEKDAMEKFTPKLNPKVKEVLPQCYKELGVPDPEEG